MRGRHGGARRCKLLLGAGDQQIWPWSAAHPTGLRQAVREATEERRRRCGSDLRSRTASDDAFCGREEREDAQVIAVVFRVRDLLVRQRTQVRNSLRGHLAEYGFITAQGPSHVAGIKECVTDVENTLPEAARLALAMLVDTLRSLEDRIRRLNHEIARRAREDEDARRLATIPGIGPITATALLALAPAVSFAKQPLRLESKRVNQRDPLLAIRRVLCGHLGRADVKAVLAFAGIECRNQGPLQFCDRPCVLGACLAPG